MEPPTIASLWASQLGLRAKGPILIFKRSLIVLQRGARIIIYLCVDWSLRNDLDC